ncbi:hypothetical protein JCM10908_000196 [Rhodotorula pacifica]|uniref:uncharacterized protein n=1 Tax=Rhodotorula pacifica TaxID=1495444 RepID=UPI00316FA282
MASSSSSPSPRRDPIAASPSRRQQRARSRSPAPATTHSLSALHSPPLHSTAAAGGGGSPALSPTGSGAGALPSPARSGASAAGAAAGAGAAVASAFATRPAPVVPPSPSVPATPAFSRPTSPHPPASRLKDEPSSPVRGRAGEAAEGAALSQSTSQVDLNHIFERDVEFPTTHHITPSEAVDVAVPPVLTEAAVALSAADDDPIASRDLAALVLDAEQDAQANSGWSSPVLPPGVSLHQWHQQQHHQQQHQPPHQLSHATYANASRSPVRGMRSFSPDSSSLGGGRAASPGSSYFSAGTPPTSAGGGSPPPVSMSATVQSTAGAAFGPFSQRLAEALENEASKLPAGLTGASAAAVAASAPQSSSSPELSPRSDASSPSRYGSQSVLSPTLLRPFPTGTSALSNSSDDPFAIATPSPLASPSIETGSSLHPPTSASSSATPTPASVALANAAATSTLSAAPHPRKLSFATYADLVNEERLAELTGERLAPEAATPGGGSGTGAQTPGAGPAASPGGVAGGALGLSRSRSGTHSSGIVEQLESRLAAAGLGIRSAAPSTRSGSSEAAAAPA